MITTRSWLLLAALVAAGCTTTAEIPETPFQEEGKPPVHAKAEIAEARDIDTSVAIYRIRVAGEPGGEPIADSTHFETRDSVVGRATVAVLSGTGAAVTQGAAGVLIAEIKGDDMIAAAEASEGDNTAFVFNVQGAQAAANAGANAGAELSASGCATAICP